MVRLKWYLGSSWEILKDNGYEHGNAVGSGGKSSFWAVFEVVGYTLLNLDVNNYVNNVLLFFIFFFSMPTNYCWAYGTPHPGQVCINALLLLSQKSGRLFIISSIRNWVLHASRSVTYTMEMFGCWPSWSISEYSVQSTSRWLILQTWILICWR